jgi:hypothetical protein
MGGADVLVFRRVVFQARGTVCVVKTRYGVSSMRQWALRRRWTGVADSHSVPQPWAHVSECQSRVLAACELVGDLQRMRVDDASETGASWPAIDNNRRLHSRADAAAWRRGGSSRLLPWPGSILGKIARGMQASAAAAASSLEGGSVAHIFTVQRTLDGPSTAFPKRTVVLPYDASRLAPCTLHLAPCTLGRPWHDAAPCGRSRARPRAIHRPMSCRPDHGTRRTGGITNLGLDLSRDRASQRLRPVDRAERTPWTSVDCPRPSPCAAAAARRRLLVHAT